MDIPSKDDRQLHDTAVSMRANAREITDDSGDRSINGDKKPLCCDPTSLGEPATRSRFAIQSPRSVDDGRSRSL